MLRRLASSLTLALAVSTLVTAPLTPDGCLTSVSERGRDRPAGQTLCVLASATSDTFLGASGRTPGIVTLENTRVHLPVVP